MAEQSMLGELIRKEAAVRAAQDQVRKTHPEATFGAAVNEVKRQVKQVAIQNQGNPISGEGITKSGDTS